MMRKYVDDAEKVMAADRDRRSFLREERVTAAQRVLVVKRCLLGIALAGVGCGLYFAHDLGGMVATNMSATHFSAPVVDSAPVSKAKYMRKLSENRKEREEELSEIEKF